MKYPRASGALRQAPDPMLKKARFARMTLLCTVGNLSLSQSGAPLDQILDPPLVKKAARYSDCKCQILLYCIVLIADSGVSPSDPGFIGCWWIPFVLYGLMMIMSSLPLLFFPKYLYHYRTAEQDTCVL